MNWRSVLKRVLAPMLVLMLSWGMVSCSQSSGIARKPLLSRLQPRLTEIAPPASIQELKQYTDVYQPQVTILSPRQGEVLDDTQTSVKLQVRDLPLFKDEELELGYHLHFILDNQPYQPIFSVDEPIVLNDLEPGTHTIRVFASRPWHESYKNEGAFAETTFHVFAKTPQNNPDPRQPLLTYSRPKGDYGAEPVLLDFYLTNAPLHFVAQEDSSDAIPDWQIRGTINGESFTFDRWEPIYLQGLKPGRNWIQLELLDENGNPLLNAFNNTIRIVNYQPNGTDALSRLVRGEIPVAIARRITDPDYTPPVEPAAEEAPSEEFQAEPAIEETQETEESLPARGIEEAEPQPAPALEDSAAKAVPAVPPVLQQPAEEESIREELADEVKEQLQDQPEPFAEAQRKAAKEQPSVPVVPAPAQQPASESSQPRFRPLPEADRLELDKPEGLPPSDRPTEKFTDKFTDKFSEARERAKERAKGLMNRMRKPNESAPDRGIESPADAPAVPPVIKAPEAIEVDPSVAPSKTPDAAPAPAIPPIPEIDDLPPTLPEIIEEPETPAPSPAPPPSRLPAPVPRFLTLGMR